MEVVKCKRCGHVLSSPKSIEQGYGDTCYRIIQLQKSEQPEVNTDYIDLKNKWNQLSLKFTTMERKLKQLEVNGSTAHNPDVNLDWKGNRNKPDNHRPERNANIIQFTMVVKELKVQLEKGINSMLQKVGSFDNEINFLEAPVEILA